MISSRRLGLFIIGSHSLVGYLYYLASDLPGPRPPGLQTRQMGRSWGWEGAASARARRVPGARAEGPGRPRRAGGGAHAAQLGRKVEKRL